MSSGTLYASFRIRSVVPRALVNHFKLDVTIVDPTKSGEQFAKDFPLKKVPAFVGAKGYKLTELMAVNYYLLNMVQDTAAVERLTGKNAEEKAQIIRWESLSNSDLISQIVAAFLPLKGDAPYNKKAVDTALETIDKIAAIYETRLTDYTFLATENISLADLVSACLFTRGFNYLFGKQWRADHPAIVRWYKTVIDSEIMKPEFTDFKFIDEPLAPPQKKKEKKPAQEPKKKQEKPAQAAEAAPAAEKKPKHPLELLGKSAFSLDEWKRTYSNEDTRPVALPWFWEHYNPEEWSLWRVDYKYNDELTLTFMSNNLIGGFFNRLSASTKYMFGSLVVYGENNNNGIIGAILIRGQDYVPAFDVAPDWESYAYTKLDATKDEDREFVNNMWAWDKPVIVNGEPREIADGKVLK
ncbi:translation elongation factor EF1B gamma KNAG_0A02170 [Huiozyma naganishii CBS 8797]|uniref:Elongation factor 1-gamma 1 n=1 Tax=Huiozyma naganishii (strain ATCC MYA-139 / BCRC 22969 / CBS 8797 / KCTC 17520 / NBRC 10181 / NCYC 3082 / Yp74L-3) TaxID=1071383 RepID=J7S3B5_HUIN7|nr:hypothetical protein KNAG_0A02170 [Kazachstania naganishii CBS 8797]CCK67906.1 hypothetical protein KNAG_0A02170 [Kazachstania naganishii CBS 8797]